MFFYREIFQVVEKTVVIKVPDGLIGKTIEIIAFEIEEDENSNTIEKPLDN